MTDEEELQELRKSLNDMGRFFKGMLPETWGFVVLLFPFGQHGTLLYTSNASRGDVVKTMEEFIEATKDAWLVHKPEDDAELGRLRQRVTELERELAIAKRTS